MIESALSRLFPALTLKAATAEAAALGLTLKRDPDCKGLFLIYPKGDRGPAKSCETLPAALAWAAAWALVARHDSNGAPFWGFNGGPTDSDLARAILYRALAACPAGLAEIAESVAMARAPQRGGPVALTMRAGLAAWGPLPEWQAEESGSFSRFAAGDSFESGLAYMAEALAARVITQACQRIAAAANVGESAPAWAFPDPAAVPVIYALPVARAAYGAAEELAAAEAPELIKAARLARMAGPLFRKALPEFSGHGRRARIEESAMRAEALAAELSARIAATPSFQKTAEEMATPELLAQVKAEAEQMKFEIFANGESWGIFEAESEKDAIQAAANEYGTADIGEEIASTEGMTAIRAQVKAEAPAADLAEAPAADLAEAPAADLAEWGRELAGIARESAEAERAPMLARAGRYLAEAAALGLPVAAEARALAAEAEAAKPGPRTIDATPTWAGLLPALLLALTHGTAEGQAIAREELARMAAAADLALTAQKARQSAEAEAEGLAELAEGAAADLSLTGAPGHNAAALTLARKSAAGARRIAARLNDSERAQKARDKAATAATYAAAVIEGRAANARAEAAARGRFPMLGHTFAKDAAAAWERAAILAEAPALGRADLARLARVAADMARAAS